MEKEFVTYELALKLKQLGFDEPCFGKWLSSLQSNWKDYELILEMGMNEEFEDNRNVYLLQEACSAPTYSQAFRWFREKYSLFSSILPFQDIEDDIRLCYYYCVINLDECKDEDILCNESSLGASDINFSSLEDAELACLEKLIEIVEQKNNEDETN
jgi:hypothetical protein